MRFSPWAALAVACASVLFAGADWVQFRGPGGLGRTEATGLPVSWSATEGLAWRTALPGFGTSSPIIVGDRIYLTCYTGYGEDAMSPGALTELRRMLVALNKTTGAVLWQKPLPVVQPEQSYQGFMALHGYASSTPVSDGKQIYVFSGSAGVSALTLDGEPVWNTSVGTRTHGWGSATSPVLHDGLVIVNASVESGSLVALNAADGKQAWRVDGMARAWNTPLLVKAASGRDELITSVQGKLIAVDPAAGKELWTAAGIQDYVCPSLIAYDDRVVAIGGRGKPGVGVKLGGSGDVTEANTVLRTRANSNVSSPVYWDGHIYFVNESRGVAYCLAADSGDIIYEQRLEPRPDRFYASPLAGDGKLYYVSRQSGVYVLAAKPEYQLLAHNKFDDDSVFNASPVEMDGRLLFRSDKFLYCVGAPY